MSEPATPAVESPEAAIRRGETEDDVYRFGRPPEDLPAFANASDTRETDFSGIEIEVLDLAHKKDRATFNDCALPLYGDDPNYIAPLRMHMMKFLDPRHNPAFENLEVRPMIARQNGRIVGRLTAHVDKAYSKYHETETGFFGFFESINDRKVAHALFTNASDWLRSKGCVEVFGPMNFTMSHQVGLLVENFERPPYVEELYNPEFYVDLVESFGFAKAKDWFVWRIDCRPKMETKNRKRVKRIAERIAKRERVVIKKLDLSNQEKEIDKLYDIYMAAWQKNWSFVPLSKKEFSWLAKDLKSVAIPDLIMFIEVDGKPIGFCATLPNINEVLPRNGRLLPFAWWKALTKAKKTKTGRLYTLGVVPEFRKRGLESLMFMETVLACNRCGIEGGEIGMTLEDNDLINRAIETMDGWLDRKYRIYGMTL